MGHPEVAAPSPANRVAVAAAPRSISLVLPVHNEQAAVADVIHRGATVLHGLPLETWEIVAVDDGSDDATPEILARLAQDIPELRVIRRDSRGGFATVQGACYKAASCDWIALWPADGQLDPCTLLEFLPFCTEYDAICGAVRGAPDGMARTAISWAYHTAVEFLFGLGLGRFGACLLVRRALVAQLTIRSTTPVAMTELLVRARAAGARLAAVEVTKLPRTGGVAHGGRVLTDLPRIISDLIALRRTAAAT